MAAPLEPRAKRSVDLGSAAGAVTPGSRIRRTPPPKAEAKTVVLSRSERDRNAVLAGIALSAALLVTLLAGLAAYSGWTPRQVVIEIVD